MERTIITRRDLARRGRGPLPSGEPARADSGPVKPDDYKQRLLKYIPTEVVALYLTLDVLVRSSGEKGAALFWCIFAFGVLATPLYLWRVGGVAKRSQLAISTVAFVVWILAIGGPFTHLGWYKPLYGGILLPMYTFLIPVFEPAKAAAAAPRSPAAG